jgi:hypothetical protein
VLDFAEGEIEGLVFWFGEEDGLMVFGSIRGIGDGVGFMLELTVGNVKGLALLDPLGTELGPRVG